MEQPFGPHALIPNFIVFFFFFLAIDRPCHFVHFTRSRTTKLGGVKIAPRHWEVLFGLSIQKGGVTSAEAGNHPGGRGWRGGGTLRNKVQVTSQCQCRPFKGQQTRISDNNAAGYRPLSMLAWFWQGGKESKFSTQTLSRQCVSYIRPHLLYMLNAAFFHQVMDVFPKNDLLCTYQERDQTIFRSNVHKSSLS